MTRALVVACVLSAATAEIRAQDSSPDPGASLPTVRIDRPVIANGMPLAPGMYGIRVTDERPALPSGEPSQTQRWVEFVAGGMVVGRDIAEIVPAEADADAVGTSSSSGPPRAVVQLLKEGDFVRVSIRDADVRYLIYLPPGASIAP